MPSDGMTGVDWHKVKGYKMLQDAEWGNKRFKTECLNGLINVTKEMNVTNKEKNSKTQEKNAQWQNKRCRETK
jgi:hypothetical protein